jgi:hypothetical protein
MARIKTLKAICSVNECNNLVNCRGLCNKHYLRWRHHGDTSIVLNNRNMSTEERFWIKVNKTDGCWLWTGNTLKGGYGYFWFTGKNVLAHRFAYELLVGPIPDGLELDHIKNNGCTNRNCVKAIADEFGPAHLEPVTRLENQRRGNTFTARNSSRTECPKGHSYEGENLYIHPSSGRRGCRICINISAKKYRERVTA